MDDRIEVGPFAVHRTIGEGGMGSVYRGRHRKSGHPLAIKVIRREAGGEVRRRFREEVQAHASLLHPGIVYLFEYGEIGAEAARASDRDLREGNPYVAMELADRGTVRDAMPLSSWDEARRILVQMLDGLAHAHARGVVHRDLKPENLLVFEAEETSGPEWRVKLADFGIAHALGSERDAKTDKLESAAGTPMYMSPEQLRGQWRRYGPWTDLYAVGCIAWELVCGQPPFDGDSALAIAIKHETEERPPLDPQFPVPDELDRWVRQLMAVDPEDRFQRAADAVWALPTEDAPEGRTETADGPVDQLGGERADRGRDRRRVSSRDVDPGADTVTMTKTLPFGDESLGAEGDSTSPEGEARRGEGSVGGVGFRGSGDAPPVPERWRPEQVEPLPTPLADAGLGLFGLREPPFVDRQDECDRIWEALRRVVQTGEVETVFVAGEAGAGKSRLVEWIATRAQEVGAASVVRAVQTPDGGPSEGLRSAFERTLRTLKMDRDEIFEHVDDTLPPLATETDRKRDLRALTEYLRPTDEDSDDIEGPQFQFSSARQRRRLVSRLLRRLCTRRPVVLWLDDLQWGTEALAFLEHIHDSPAESPRMLVLATVRSDVVAENRRLTERFEALRRFDRTHWLDLTPLSRSYQRELLEGLLPLNSNLAEELAERTEGHPLFAMQLLNHWIDGGDIEAGDEGFGVKGEREVELPEDIHDMWIGRIDRFAESLAVVERSDLFEMLELAAALGREVIEEEWRAICAESDLEPPSDFVERLVERGLAERTAEGWSFTHGLLVESLELRAREAGQWRRHHRRCARLYEEILDENLLGTRPHDAGDREGAGEADRDVDPVLAARARHLEQAGSEKAPEAYLRAARAGAGAYRYERALDLAETGLELEPDGATRFELACVRAEQLLNLGKPREAIEGYRDAVDWADDREDRARSHIGIASGLRVCEEYEAALDELQSAERALGDEGASELVAEIHYLRGNLCFPRGELERCAREHEQSLEIARSADLPRHVARALSGLGDAHYMRGWISTAREYFARCIDHARQHGLAKIEAANAPMYGLTELYHCRSDEAMQQIERSIELAERAGDLRAQLLSRSSTFDVLSVRADWEELRSRADESIALAEQLGARQFLALSKGYRGLAATQMGDVDEGVSQLEDAWTEICEHGEAFAGAGIAGLCAYAMPDDEKRELYLERGERVLTERSVSHNFLVFYPLGMITCWELDDPDGVVAYAERLAEYTADEPLPWTELCREWTDVATADNPDDAALDSLADRIRESGLRIFAGPVADRLDDPPASPTP